jgi:hypothetical protein
MIVNLRLEGRTFECVPQGSGHLFPGWTLGEHSIAFEIPGSHHSRSLEITDGVTRYDGDFYGPVCGDRPGA